MNPFSAYGFNFDKDELLSRMQARVNVPVLNVLEDVRVEDMAWHAEDMRAHCGPGGSGTEHGLQPLLRK